MDNNLDGQTSNEDAIKTENEFIELLVDATAEINTTLDLKQVLDKILDNIFKVVPYDEAKIILIEKQKEYRLISVNSLINEYPTDFVSDPKPMHKDLLDLEKLVKTGKKILISDVEDHPDWFPANKGAEGIRSYLGVPIQQRGKLLGFINLTQKIPNAFSEDQARKIQIFANFAASAIENAKLINEIQRVAQEMAALNEIIQRINADTHLEETLIATLHELKSIVPIDAFGITLYEKQSHLVETHLYYPDGTKIDIPPFNLLETGSVSLHVIENKKKVYVPNVFADNSAINSDNIDWIEDFRSKTLLATPLVRRGEIFGVLIIGSKEVDAYNSTQIKLIETIALQSSAAIDNARLFEKVQEQAITDDLTGLDNRRHLDLMLNREIERSKRYKHHLSLIMLDIDRFKVINDQYGHPLGDFILSKLGHLIKKSMRKTDAAFRYGGEEFIILLPETGLDQALLIAERFRKSIEAAVFLPKQVSIKITVSIGVCEFDDQTQDAEALISLVDKALYKAKAAGRNCVRYCNS